MIVHRPKKFLLVASLAILVPALVVAKKKEQPRPLRMPFGLTLGLSKADVKAQLATRGITRTQRTPPIGGEDLITRRMNGQISYGDFVPQAVIATFEQDKLTSISLLQNGIPGCSAAQPALTAALQFATDNYDPKESQVTQEPSTDIIDCGPHFDPADYELHRESKTFVLAIALKYVQNHQLAIGATYFDRTHFKPITTDGTDNGSKSKNQTTQNNL